MAILGRRRAMGTPKSTRSRSTSSWPTDRAEGMYGRRSLPPIVTRSSRMTEPSRFVAVVSVGVAVLTPRACPLRRIRAFTASLLTRGFEAAPRPRHAPAAFGRCTPRHRGVGKPRDRGAAPGRVLGGCRTGTGRSSQDLVTTRARLRAFPHAPQSPARWIQWVLSGELWVDAIRRPPRRRDRRVRSPGDRGAGDAGRAARAPGACRRRRRPADCAIPRSPRAPARSG